jgi:hypothetical protein
VSALGPEGWPCVEHVRGASGYRKQGMATEAPVVVPAIKGLDEAIAANHSLKEEIDLLDLQLAELRAEKEKDAASLAEMIAANEALQREVSALRTQHHQANELIDDKERATEEMRRNRDEVQERLNHAVARITFLEKELSSAVKAETRNSSTPTTVDESASGPSAGAAGPDASHSSAVDQTPPPGSQGSGSPVSSSSPTTAPQKPAAAPKGMQQQAKGR